jgi:hypothetical protein
VEHDRGPSGSVMAGAAWFVGGAFCPGISTVQGMQRFAGGPMYTTLARRVLLAPGFAKKFEETEDLYTRAAVKWLNSREHLPEILAKWRRTALNRAQRGEVSAGKGSGGDLKKSKRKLQSAARRKNRQCDGQCEAYASGRHRIQVDLPAALSVFRDLEGFLEPVDGVLVFPVSGVHDPQFVRGRTKSE